MKKGDKIKKGQPFSTGPLDLKKLLRIRGKEETWRYIINEIQKVYASQGVNIHDKHIEVIVKKMFSRVRIKSEGDIDFIPGEVVPKEKFLEENEKVKKEGKKPATAKELVLGITKVALTTDSFLSSASFQETSRVLIKASLEGQEDKLRGLKENVIIGKLVPAGTGFEESQQNNEKAKQIK